MFAFLAFLLVGTTSAFLNVGSPAAYGAPPGVAFVCSLSRDQVALGLGEVSLGLGRFCQGRERFSIKMLIITGAGRLCSAWRGRSRVAPYGPYQ